MSRAFSRRPRWWLAVVQVVLLLVTMVAPASAATDPPAMTGTQLIDLLRHYNIVRGDDRGNLNLQNPITRAEMITIVVRAAGGEKDAELYQSFNFFTDSADHWAKGYISYAYMKKLVKGDGNDLVRPNAYISYAEALTLILRVLGKEPTTGDWPINIIMAATELNLVPDGVTYATIRDQAIRGLIFQSLAKAITTVKDDQGKTYIQKYIDVLPPRDLTLGQTPASTKATSVTIQGTVKEATSVTVNGNAVTLNGTAFNTEVPLTLGANEITVVAYDLAGNSATKTVNITRVPPIATLEIAGAAKVRPGARETYTITSKDSDGRTVALEGVTATVTGNIGTFDLATKTLTAAATPAKGKITLTAGTVTKSIDVEVMGPSADAVRLNIRQINNGLAVSYTKPMTVVVEVLNASNQLVDADYGRQVTLVATGLTGLNVSPAAATTQAGVASFTVTSSMAGVVGLQAATANLTGSSYTAEFGTNLRVRLSTDPATITIGSGTAFTRIRATLVDENGNPTVNTGEDINIQLYANGTDGSLSDPYVRIIRGTSSSLQSGDEGLYTVGAQPGSVSISGVINSTQRYTVDPTYVNATIPSIGSGARFDVVAYQPYTPNQANGVFYVRVVDGNGIVIPGSFAFQLKVDTSNNEPKSSGIPAGVSLTLGDTGVNPVNDGITEGSAGDGGDVIVRTVAGTAAFRVAYNKPGQVTVTVQPAAGTTLAYATDGTVGTATQPNIPERAFTLNFSQQPTGVKLRVDSEGFGTNNETGAVSPGRAFTLRAFLTDASGNWTPATTAVVTLTKVSGTSTNANTTTVSAADGKAEFTVYATGNVGEDVYRVSANLTGNPTSNDVHLYVQNAAPAAPSILAIRGTNNGVPGTLYYVGPSDSGMEIELAQNTALRWAVVKVYAESGALLYTSTPVDMSSPAPRITVPRTSLPNGVYRYQVALKNGYGESPRSLSSGNVTTAVQVTNFTFTNAKYQRTTKQLTLYGSGFGNSNDTVNPALLTITDATTGQSVVLAGAPVTINNYNQLTINLSALTGVTTALEDTSRFSGSDVTISAGAGWYTRVNGEQSAAITPGAVVGPMAAIQSAVYDRVNSRLFLNGAGFNGVNIDFSKLKLQATGLTDIALVGLATTRVNDTQWLVTLTPNIISALEANGGYTLNVVEGWAYDSSWIMPGTTNLSLYAQLMLTGVTYTKSNHTVKITGSGFTGGALTSGVLQFTNKDRNQTVNLTGTPTIVSDSELQIVLDQTAYDVLEDTTKFQATDSIYLIGPNGWFTNAANRPAAAIPDRTLRLSLQP